MKTRTKGNLLVRRCIEILKSQGYIVADVERRGKFIKVKDMFGLFDLCAIHENGDIMFIQVTGKQPHPHKLYNKFSKRFAKTYLNVQQWSWQPYKGFKVFKYENGRKTILKTGAISKEIDEDEV